MLPFTPATLHQVLKGFPVPRHYWVAFSGGLDSSVLVHAMVALRPELGAVGLSAVHIDHSLSPHSRAWSCRCEAVCQQLELDCLTLRVEVRRQPGESPEAAARYTRYRALESCVGEQECLLTAHQQDDQAETVLLQLLRGSGIAGLAAMPGCTLFGRGWLVRPLLGFTRAALRAYAKQSELPWVEDESNFDVRLDRNYLRHQVVPHLRERWPGYAQTLARAAAHTAEASQLLKALARMDLEEVRGDEPGALSVSRLRVLDPPRQRNLIRFWLHHLELPTPSAARLNSILDDILTAAPDRNPRIAWPGAEVRRYRDRLYAMPPLPVHDPAWVLPWDLREPLALAYGSLHADAATGRGLSASACERLAVTVRFRQGGERCRPIRSPHSRPLKHLFQEYGVPPWLRDRVPLVYLGDALAAVGDLWVCQPFEAQDTEPGWVLRWKSGHITR